MSVFPPVKKKAKKTSKEAIDFLNNLIVDGLPSVLVEPGLVEDNPKDDAKEKQ